ncbi:hypothetical protein DFQ14_104160 [Halopolyspora algeriensis]|uniref:OB-fold protein n=1 Tax=Halopolyspora algeriensis TaxID=1500506 RepID=A0A368VS51_9ACTN|nr:bifunctional MaoC family dehydratase N-terminal/OB-fold nucleic acid binding domain-containing protein [Halopolyspora algeriensis]RCW44571.1 hypothetical protein DFQ14_104160 [Halopolyspora algeriensis]TQM55931.1 hypothetical protein FHU43_0709 [Halopolyspora algeriensis]
MTSTASSATAAKDTGPARDNESVHAAAERISAAGESRPRPGRDPVNLPMIHNWAEALGDGNPVYTNAEYAETSVHGGLVAPPAMAQVWTMGGLHPEPAPDDPMRAMTAALDEAGYTSVVATNCEQTYHRYLRHGEHVAVTTKLEEVTGPKRTGLGEGWFLTLRYTWYVDTEAVAEMMFRLLKFRPADGDEPARPTPEPAGDNTADESDPRTGSPILPAINRDTAYFWEGTAAGELRIQRCGRCGLLRHPPGPMCSECGATKPTHLVACGHGQVYSYVVHHRPPVPGKELPLVIALVELDEGVRVLGELHGIDPDEVHIGLDVEVFFRQVDEQVTLPCWRPRTEGK